MNKLKAIVLLALVSLVVIFAVQNAVTVEIEFLVWTFTIPRALLVLLVLAVGFALGLIASSLKVLRK